MYWDIEQEGGFNFEKFERNKMLEKKGMQFEDELEELKLREDQLYA